MSCTAYQMLTRGPVNCVFLMGEVCGRRSGLMVCALVSGSSGSGSGALAGNIVLCSWAKHFDELTAGVGVEILLVTSCYGNRDRLRPDEPLSYRKRG